MPGSGRDTHGGWMAPGPDSRRDRDRRAARLSARIAGSAARAAGPGRRALLGRRRRGRRAFAGPAAWAAAAVLLALACGVGGWLVLDPDGFPGGQRAETARGGDLFPDSVLLTEENWADYQMLERGRRVHAELEGTRREGERVQARLRILGALLDRAARERERERARFAEAAWADRLTQDRARRRTAGLESSLEESRRESGRIGMQLRVRRALHERDALERAEERARSAEATWAAGLTRERARRRTAELEESLEASGEAVRRARTEARILLLLANRMAYELRADIERVRKLLASTGVGLERLAEGDGVRALARGGPFEGVDDAFGAAAATLDEELDRRRALRDVLRRIPLAPPLDYYRLSSKYGMRKDPVNGRRAMHHGIDMVPPFLARVVAPAPGAVTFSGRNGAYGRFVEIDHGNGIVTRYGHLRHVYVKRGDEVGFRDRIAQVGRTGRSTGVHLHYEITIDGKSVDPLKFIKAGRHVFED